jgi:hypothetical protein
LKHKAHTDHNHKLNHSSITQDFVDEVEGPLNTSKVKITLEQSNSENHHHEEDSKKQA